jgi:signal transduction histidine kinase
MIGLRYNLDTLLKEETKWEDELHRKFLEKSISSADKVIEMIRNLAYSLRPPMLDVLGFDKAVLSLCNDFSQTTGILVEYDSTSIEKLADETAISLYRILQESLTNVAKHASANKVLININRTDDSICMEIADNGIGIREGDGRTGVGIIGMRERVDMLGGWLKFILDENGGTKLIVTVPQDVESEIQL